jgi:hypothetical protein
MTRFCVVFAALVAAPAWGSDPWADHVLSYQPGAGAAPGYQNPLTALGEPSRFTADLMFPSVVSPYSPAFGTDQIVSLGAGGSLVLRFDEPVMNDAANPFGVDLLVFGNAGYSDTNFPGGPAGALFGAGGGTVEVSQDGSNWVLVPGAAADGAFPTLGYVGLTDPYAPAPIGAPTDFTLPLNPGFSGIGLPFAQLIAAYGNSGGGSGIDLAAAGLAWASYVRISNPAGATSTVEVDALSDVAPVPGPGSLAVLLAATGLCRRRRA